MSMKPLEHPETMSLVLLTLTTMGFEWLDSKISKWRYLPESTLVPYFVVSSYLRNFKLFISMLYYGCTNYNFDKYTYGKHEVRASYKIDPADITTYK